MRNLLIASLLLSACSPGQSEYEAPGVVDAGAVWKQSDRQLALQLCQGECWLARAPGCPSLDSPAEVSACLTNCSLGVPRIRPNCLDAYSNLHTCIGRSPAPVFACTLGPWGRPVTRDPGLCGLEGAIYSACRMGW